MNIEVILRKMVARHGLSTVDFPSGSVLILIEGVESSPWTLSFGLASNVVSGRSETDCEISLSAVGFRQIIEQLTTPQALLSSKELSVRGEEGLVMMFFVLLFQVLKAEKSV